MRVLVICSSFPPVNATAVHRTLAVCRQLVASGHALTVVTMPPMADQPLDESLMRKVPPGIRIIHRAPWSRPWRRKMAPTVKAPGAESVEAKEAVRPKGIYAALRGWLAEWLQVPDSRTSWLAPAVAAAMQEAHVSRPDVIYSTAPAWTAHMAACCVSRRLGLPWLADCRDPWCANPFRRFRHAAHRRADHYFERQMVRAASVVVCNTEPVREEFLRRYGRWAARFEVVHNGYDEDAIAAIRNAAPPPRGARCLCVHTGSFYGERSPMPLLRGLAMLARQRPELAQCLEFQQIGSTMYQGSRLTELARQLGVETMVRVTETLPYEESLRRIHEADVGVVGGHSGAGSDLQIPRKLYEYLGLGKPILVTGGTCRAVRSLLNGDRQDWLFLANEGGDEASGVCEALGRLGECWRSGRLPRQWDAGGRFGAAHMARRIEQLLHRSCRRHAFRRGRRIGGVLC